MDPGHCTNTGFFLSASMINMRLTTILSLLSALLNLSSALSNDTFGLGISLASGYGTVSATFDHGSYIDIAKIEGGERYKAYMLGVQRDVSRPTGYCRLPDLMCKHWPFGRNKADNPLRPMIKALVTAAECYHFDSIWDKLQYAKQRAQRRLNKALGRPAAPETAILANMVGRLYDETQSWLGSAYIINSAALSSPDRVRLADEEIDDVFDYLKLNNLMCEEEEWYMPFQYVLHIDYSPASLSATIKNLRGVHDGLVLDVFVEFDLGYGNENKDPAHRRKLASRLRQFVKYQRPAVIDDLLLTGTSVTNPRFTTTLREALQDLVTVQNVLGVLPLEGDENGGVEGEKWTCHV
ncbi:hypothetical protein Slin15195_G061760 [Septoria linicola]|uniref:Uncharacterized protein n=1 Tax=Septoria linicola TaxID=215465 RepID=A0A9Q9AVS5_9PEZI|nr:hypothetical protein Slin15195_G061760 [Septoria linicola]